MTTSVSPDPKAVKPAPSQPEAAPAPAQPSPGRDFARSREQMVLVMMVLVAAAVALVMRMHFDATLGSAIVSGFVAWASFMIAHLLVKRSSENGRMRLEILRLEHELVRTRAPQGSQSAPHGAPQAVKAPGTATAEARIAVKAPQPRPFEMPDGAKAGMQPAPAAPGLAVHSAPAMPSPAMSGPGVPVITTAKMADELPYTHAPISVDARWEQTQPPRAAGKLSPPQAHEASRPAPGTGRETGRDLARERDSERAAPQHPRGAQAPLGRDQMARMSASQHPANQMPASQSPASYASGAAPHMSAHSTSAHSVAPRDGARPTLTDVPSWSGTAVANADPLQDAWSFRPRDAADQRIFAPDAEGVTASPGTLPRPLEADLELVQRKIKALADEVNAAEALKQSPPHQSSPNAIDHSIAALRSTAGRMRGPAETQASASRHGGHPAAAQSAAAQSAAAQSSAATSSHGAPPAPAQPKASTSSVTLPSLDALIPATAETIATSQPAPRREEPAPDKRPSRPSPQQQRIQEIAAAIDAGRMDVYLHPIVGLGDYAVSHFEVAVRLKGANGNTIERPEQILNLGATDILALFDIERLNRAAIVAGQLEARGKTGSILSPTSGHAMTDANFLEAFAHTFESRTSIANQLVLTFTQADVTSFGHGTWQALDDMRSFGFRFALEHVTHLGIDFADLAEKGFEFVKLPADAFLAGMAAENGFVPAADICRHIAGAGLTLVVEAVNDDETLARVFGFGALYGQGQLFGGARQISLEAIGPNTAAA